MNKEIRETIITALQNHRGDDYERARRSFANCSNGQMQEKYGASGMTRRQILDGYKHHVDLVDAAIEYVQGLK